MNTFTAASSAAKSDSAKSERATRAAKKTLFFTRVKTPSPRRGPRIPPPRRGLSNYELQRVQARRACPRDISAVERAVHDPDHPRLLTADARVPVVDRGIRRKRPGRNRPRRGGEAGRRRVPSARGGPDGRRRIRAGRRPGHDEGHRRERRRRSDCRHAVPPLRTADRELALRLLERHAGPHARQDPFDVSRRNLFERDAREEKARLDRGELVTAGAAREEVLPEGPLLARGENAVEVLGKSNADFAARRAHRRPRTGSRPGQIRAISRRKTRRALKRWLRTVDSPHFRICAISLVSQSSISFRTKTAFCLPVSRPETVWKSRASSASSRAFVVSRLVISSRMRTR